MAQYGSQALYCFPIITKNHRKFLEKGDFGAFIMLKGSCPDEYDGVVVGLGFARNKLTKASYMMPMDLVMKSIEKTTDCKVLEPVYVGEVPGREPIISD
ncbi:hypothetical protein P154DRAFT_522260, partial [Amniculicola lignicola CBS 123094]